MYRCGLRIHCLVRFVLIGEIAALYVGHVTPYSIGDDTAYISITAQETGRESLGHAQHVGYDKNLSVSTIASTNAYRRTLHGRE